MNVARPKIYAIILVSKNIAITPVPKVMVNGVCLSITKLEQGAMHTCQDRDIT